MSASDEAKWEWYFEQWLQHPIARRVWESVDGGWYADVAMGYSVTVTAAKVMMAAVYEQIFNRKLLKDAVRLGRRELFNQKERQAYYDYQIPLEDWLLPVVYGSQ